MWSPGLFLDFCDFVSGVPRAFSEGLADFNSVEELKIAAAGENFERLDFLSQCLIKLRRGKVGTFSPSLVVRKSPNERASCHEDEWKLPGSPGS
jgi:hypothetical protein